MPGSTRASVSGPNAVGDPRVKPAGDAETETVARTIRRDFFQHAFADGHGAIHASGDLEVVRGDQRRHPVLADQLRPASQTRRPPCGRRDCRWARRPARSRCVGQRAGDRRRAAARRPRACLAMLRRPSSPPESAVRWRAGGGTRRDLPAISCGNDHVLERREFGQQMMELIDVADCVSAQRGPLVVELAGREPVISTSPPCGRSSRPEMCSRVDLPAPDGATMATSLAALHLEVGSSRARRTSVSPSP